MWRPMQAPVIRAGVKAGVPSNWPFARQETHVEKDLLKTFIWQGAAADAKESLAIAHSECVIAHEVHGAAGAGKISDCLLDHVGSVEDGMEADGRLSQETTLFTVHVYPGPRLGEFWHQGIVADEAAAPLLFATVAAQALESLMKVNTAKYVHRGIGLGAFGVGLQQGRFTVRLTDFDLALKAEEDATREGSSSNLNAPPEWTEKEAFSKKHPYTFDNYQLANLLMQLLTGMSMLELFYVSWDSIFQKFFSMETLAGKDAWCDAENFRHKLCDFHHMRAVFAYVAKNQKTSYSMISVYVNMARRSKKAELPLAGKVWDVMVKDFPLEFAAFMEVVGSMLRTRPEERPADARAVRESPALKALLRAVQARAHEGAEERDRAAQQQKTKKLDDKPFGMAGPRQQSAGPRFERTSNSQCYFADGPRRNEVDATGVDVSATVCMALCAKDGGCTHYAVSARGGCLVYTRTAPEDFRLAAAEIPPLEGRKVRDKLEHGTGFEANEYKDAGWECYR
eukprot:CAMPEP_0168415354 /NCGR_PEP_ID=MMETSP0228-20121227/30191_1 /TAXON_ID=133427 /ORGANISM="Protoceratium reticulatum, Strain CCCM 535 (=CCMP 1889)" /LENGTH=509 /DNA_ID=CAMNT_0008429165 /DNA_START=1 /DNA_END=1527 /DNA_ORIENTATION=-